MKHLSILLIITFFTFNSFAQIDRFTFGLKFSPSISWLKSSTKGLDSEGSKLGFSYGIMTDFNFTDNYSFATGLDITYRGGVLSTVLNDSLYRGTTTYRLQYIEIPLTLKMRTNEIGYFTYFGQFGLVPGINIRAKGDVEFSPTIAGFPNKATEDDIDLKDEINVPTLSLLIALGTEYSLAGDTRLMIAFAFNNGFIDVLDNKSLKATSSYFALNLGVFF